MSAYEMPHEEGPRRLVNNGMHKYRPFTAIDNPTLSPSYDPSPSPSPVPNWALVRADPSDQPEHASRGRFSRGGGASAVVAATEHHGVPTAAPGPSSDLQDLDSFLLEGGGGLQNQNSSRSRDWLADDFDHPPEVSPKKRRVERTVLHGIDDPLDFPMQMPMRLPVEVDLTRSSFDAPHDYHDMHLDMRHDYHSDMHPDINPNMAFSYYDDEELHLQPMRTPRRQLRPHLHPQMHPQMHHEEDYRRTMDVYGFEHELVPHSENGARTGRPASSPQGSPSQMPARRIATSGRHVSPTSPFGGRYMNPYFPTFPVPMGSSPYYNRAYAHPRYHYVNPANLPPSRVRKAYHLSPMVFPEQRGSHGEAYFMFPEEEAFPPHFFFPAIPTGAPAVDWGVLNEQSPSSVAAIDVPLHQDNATFSGRSPAMKHCSLPAMKFSTPDPTAKANAGEVDKKPSPKGKSKGKKATAPVATLVSGMALEQAPVDLVEEVKDEEVDHFTKRRHMSLAIDEDANWLSEFQSFVRSEFLELFHANLEDVKFRNTSRKVAHKQLGIRCRFCAHVHPGSRARRSSAYPSSTAQIYQSFNMMIRDHFPSCEHVPIDKMEMFQKLKGRNNQGAADSKHFWSYAAEKLGMVGSESGIFMDEATQRAAEAIAPFLTNANIMAASRCPPVVLVTAEDRPLITPFLYELLSRVQRVHLLDSEQRSTRKNLKVGLPGFGCRYCCQAGRLGFSRIFPTKRKGLPEKASDMYEHMKRCSLCPSEVKGRLESIFPKPDEVNAATEKMFFDRVWSRLNGGISP